MIVQAPAAAAALQLPSTSPWFTDVASGRRRILLLVQGRRCRGRARAIASEARADAEGEYERIPTGTAGAYRLVDRRSGRSVIVWGGADDGDDAPLPSAATLAWKPAADSGGNNGGAGRMATANVSGAKNMEPVRSIGRLKAHKVRALIKSSSKTKKEDIDPDLQQAASTMRDIDNPKHINNGYRKLPSTDTDEDSYWNDNLNDRKFDSSRRRLVRSDQSVSSVDSYELTRRASSSSTRWGDLSDTAMVHSNTIRKTSFDSDFFSSKSFKDIGCSEDIVKSLRSLNILRPSHIQALSYGSILEGKSCIIADQSGSGKTLAYLAPVIQSLRKEELLGLASSLPRSPRVIILAPTAELASQVLSNCRSISKSGVPFRSMVATGGFGQKTQLESLQQELDVLIATPGRFSYLLQEGFVQLCNIRCIVLDEVDILYGDEDFKQVLQVLMNSAPVSAQYLFVTATLPADTYNKVVEVFPDCEVIMGPSVHRTSSRLEEVLVDCSGEDGEEKTPDTAFANKKSALLKIVGEHHVPKTIVFCNKIETCRKVENLLRRLDRDGSGIKVLAFHAALTQDLRLANMKEFINSQSADSMFLICTDRASRGIDFANVDHVILFDFPRDPSEYVRRVGRTARGASGRGTAFVFVVGKQVSLARKIIKRNQKGHPLHQVPC